MDEEYIRVARELHAADLALKAATEQADLARRDRENAEEVYFNKHRELRDHEFRMYKRIVGADE